MGVFDGVHTITKYVSSISRHIELYYSATLTLLPSDREGRTRPFCTNHAQTEKKKKNNL